MYRVRRDAVEVTVLGVAYKRQTQRPGEVAGQSVIVVVADRSRQYAGRRRVGPGDRRRTPSPTVDGGSVAGTAPVRRLRRGVANVT